MKTFVIAENQRGLRVRDGRLVRVLEPGLHRYWLWNGRRDKVEIDFATGACTSPLVDGIEKRRWAGHDCIILPREASGPPRDNEFRRLP